MAKVLPVPDSVSAFFWDGAARGELLVQRCAGCGEFQYPPMPVCENCQSRDLVATKVSGRASLYALTVLHQAFLPEFAEDLPYTLALVDLDDAPGVRLLTNIVQAGPHQLSIGDSLEVLFEQRGDTAVPQFRPSRGGQA